MAGTPNGGRTLVLFEDKGAADFFERLRSELGLNRVTFEVGGGWTNTYELYEKLARQIDAMKHTGVSSSAAV